MSGGYFDYVQHNVERIAEQIDILISNANLGLSDYSDETVEKFRQASKALRQAYAMSQRIDWLVSGDDGEDGFHEQWAKDLAKIERELT